MEVNTIGLGKRELRMNDAKCTMTAAEFQYLKKHPTECPEHMKKEFENTLAWEIRSDRAKRAVETKRNKYKVWPDRRNLHKV